MVCDNRTLDYSGTWEWINSDSLKLTVEEKTVLEGGQLVPSTGSCGSDFEIEGGQVKRIPLESAEIFTLSLSPITVDTTNRNRKTMTLGGKSFWKFDDDPSAYQ